MIRRLFDTFRNAIFPAKCQHCGVFFHLDARGKTEEHFIPHPPHDPAKSIFCRVMAPFLCPSCLREFSGIHPPFCTQCGRMFETGSGENHQCGACIADTPPCLRVRAAGIYGGALKSVIHALKYKNKIQLVRPLGHLLFSCFRQCYDDLEIDLIIPVPLHTSRLKQRGFNQSAMLIREWPDLIRNSPTVGAVAIDSRTLIRSRKTVAQTGLGREKRQLNVKNAFSVSNASGILGKQILLVDDVYTTGSTSDECAKTLIARGAKTVSVLTLARAG